MQPINFEYHSADNGNCRVYYKANQRLYCLQLRSPGLFELLSCTSDGEPMCRVKPAAAGHIELPRGDEAIERELTAFLLDKQRPPINAPEVSHPERE